MKKTFLIAAALSLTLQLAAAGKVSLNSGSPGVGWQLRVADEVADPAALHESGYDTSGWVAAVVPGAVFTSFVEAGIEPDPNFGDNAYKVDKSKYDRDFWYRTEFAAETLPDGLHRWICFEGVNRKGEVWLNGVLLGRLDGFMDRGRFDAAPLLRRDGRKNVLAVKVHAPERPIANHASPTYISSDGWDWMPSVPGLLNGITDDVYAEASGEVTLVDPWVRTKVPSVDEGVVSLTTELKNHSAKEVSGVVKGVIMPGGIAFEKPFKLQAGKQRTVGIDPREFPQLKIDAPNLWWPNGYGEQPLYTCDLTCEIDGKVSDTKRITFGIREYSYDFVNDVFQLSVNGERIFCKGGNWGMSEWMLRCRGAEYDLKIRLHKEMNYNMIRNWIGSTTDDEFYQACDKYGILVFDDFWLNSHPNLPDDLFAFNRNAVEKIKRLRNHPCVAVWCGDNEGVPLAPLNEWLREDVKTFDGGDRWYQPISREYGFSGSGPWTNAHPIWYFTAHPLGFGDHKQDGWGFRTEIGTAVFTNYESYCKFMPEPERWPASQEMLEKHFFGRSSFNSRPDRYFATVEYNYGKAASAEEFCRKAQLLNIEANKAMYEGWQHHLWNDASGILTWMSQSAYPSFVWQTYDYYYDLNGAYWGVKKACEPIHIQWSYADNTIKVVNTSMKGYDALTATATVYNLDGSEVKTYSQRVAASSLPNRAVRVMTLALPDDANLARGKKAVGSSSGEKDYHGAEAVTDGNTGSAWSARGSEQQWVYVDLGAPVEFSTVVLTWESQASKAYKVQVSDDATDWRTVYANDKGSSPVDEIAIEPVTARYVRVLNVERTDPRRNMALYEIELYGPDAPATQLSPVHFIRLRLTDEKGRLLSENFYWRSTRLGDYRALNDLSPARLAVQTRTERRGDKCIVHATVANKGRGVAFAVRVMPVHASTGEQIVPAIMDDNYFTLLAGEKRQIEIEFDAALIEGDACKIVARAYND